MKLHKYQIKVVAQEVYNQLVEQLKAERKAITESKAYKNFPQTKTVLKELAIVEKEYKALEELSKKHKVIIVDRYNNLEAIKERLVDSMRKVKFPLPSIRPSIGLESIEHMITLQSINSDDIEMIIENVKKQISKGKN